MDAVSREGSGKIVESIELDGINREVGLGPLHQQGIDIVEPHEVVAMAAELQRIAIRRVMVGETAPVRRRKTGSERCAVQRYGASGLGELVIRDTQCAIARQGRDGTEILRATCDDLQRSIGYRHPSRFRHS